jgi:NAD(P)-dependent dehydrogenase (short-subunit alcohol dehydrogenase family)
LAAELAPIRVNAVCPGVVRSPLYGWMSDNQREEFYRTVGSGLLTHRIGEVSEIARGYLYLMTQPYATGSVLTIDGGGALI